VPYGTTIRSSPLTRMEWGGSSRFRLFPPLSSNRSPPTVPRNQRFLKTSDRTEGQTQQQQAAA
jgi:hypothetical protein